MPQMTDTLMIALLVGSTILLVAVMIAKYRGKL